MVQFSELYMTTGKTIGLTIHTFLGKVISLLFNTLSWFVIAFLPKVHLLIPWLQLPSVMILERKKRKSVTASISSPYICNKMLALDAVIFVFFFFNIEV